MSIPMYWYNDYWLQQIYKTGLESCAKATPLQHHLLSRKVCHIDEKNINIEKEGRSFVWIRVVSFVPGDEPGFENVKFDALRLYAKARKNSYEYSAIVDVVRDRGFDRLVSCKGFHVGDPITFLSITEESGNIMFVGGASARKSEAPEKCNAYLTTGRMLRCTKMIKPGDEIIVAESDSSYREYFERIDRVVISPELSVGRITKDSAGAKEAVVVDFLDGRSEVVKSGADFAFAFKP